MVSQCESYYLRDTEKRVNLKPCVLESVKYGTNGCIFSALDSSEKKSSCLWYYWFLMYSFFPISFFLSQMDTNHIYCWTAKFLLENPAVDWNHSGWTKFPPCWLLLNEPLPTPPNLPLWPIKNLPPCVLLLSTPLPPLLLTSGKATEESWAEGGFCMLVKKNNLCQRKVLQQLCCKTCTFQGWAAA